jgi:hypothetical protein
MKPAPTRRQAEYLAFIAQYSDLLDVSPSEGDVAHFFGVSAPSAHQMVVTLEAKGLLHRLPGVARSARVAVSRHVLPVIGAPASRPSGEREAVVSFASYLAARLASCSASPFVKFVEVQRLAGRVDAWLAREGASAYVRKQAVASILQAGDKAGRAGRSRPAGSGGRKGEGQPRVPEKKSDDAPSGQQSLF